MVLSLLLISSCADPVLFRIYSVDKVGFVDRKGETVIPADFEDADEFSEGLALVLINGKGGWIDRRSQGIPFDPDSPASALQAGQ